MPIKYPLTEPVFHKLGLWPTLLTCLIAGALLPLSLAPLNLWPLAFLSPGLLALVLVQRLPAANQQEASPETFQGSATVYAYSYGLGMFGAGASWVYVSIHNFGNAGVPLSILLTLLFVAGLALVFALPFALLRYLKQPDTVKVLIAFGALWVLGEWLRSWLLTGFPWLYLGYSQLSTPLSGFAPVGGVFAVSSATLAIPLALIFGWYGKRRQQGLVALSLTALLGSGMLLKETDWTEVAGPEQRIALVQPNIPQEKKWLPEYRLPSLRLYKNMTTGLENVDWIIWPEAAVPIVYNRAKPFLTEMSQLASNSNTALLTGIIYDDPDTRSLHNSAIALGEGSGFYHKTRLVPFGEYVPLEDWLRGLIAFFDLPMSAITAGEEQQAPLQMGSHLTGMAICYEIVYPDLVAARAVGTHFITTLSNDAWFGHSWGPLQHLQMAQMRALETQRYVIRATNNGISGIISANGELRLQSRQFEREVIIGSAIPRSGETPFMKLGSTPWILLCGFLLAISIFTSRATQRKHQN